MPRYRDYDDFEYGPMKHSGLGVASFSIAIGTGVLEVVVVLIAFVAAASRPGAIAPGAPGSAALGLAMCFGLVLTLSGVGLGIAGVCQGNRKTVFAVIGLVLNALILLGGGCLFVIGLLASGPF